MKQVNFKKRRGHENGPLISRKRKATLEGGKNFWGKKVTETKKKEEVLSRGQRQKEAGMPGNRARLRGKSTNKKTGSVVKTPSFRREEKSKEDKVDGLTGIGIAKSCEKCAKKLGVSGRWG